MSYLYLTDQASFVHYAQFFPQLKRLRGTLVSQKLLNLTQWYSLVKSALENGPKFTTSRLASAKKMYSFTFGKDLQESAWPSAQCVGLAIFWPRV